MILGMSTATFTLLHVIISLLGIASGFVVLFALYSRHLSGSWRWIYAASAVLALYLNVFVGVVQAFLKIPSLHALAPNGNEPPFAVAQGLVLVIFVALGIAAAKRFRPMAQTIAT